MADDEKKPKRLTAEEARAAQMQRQQQEFEKDQAQTKARQEAEAAARDQRHATVAKQILDSWYDVAIAATERGPGIGFVVLADLGFGQSWTNDPHVRKIIEAVAAEKWRAEIVQLQTSQQLRGGFMPQQEPQEGEVASGGTRGWRPAGVPRFGEHFGAAQASVLIVRWVP